MFSGLQELLVIGLIIGCLFLLPRMMQRGRREAASASDDALRRLRLSRPLRLAVVLSAIWLLVAIAIWQPWNGYDSRFLYLGILPVAAAWGLIWIAGGQRKRGPRQ